MHVLLLVGPPQCPLIPPRLRFRPCFEYDALIPRPFAFDDLATAKATLANINGADLTGCDGHARDVVGESNGDGAIRPERDERGVESA